MAKNIEMYESKGAGSYEIIYPKTKAELVMYDESRTIVDYVNEKVAGLMGVFFTFTVPQITGGPRVSYENTFELDIPYNATKITISENTRTITTFYNNDYYANGTSNSIKDQIILNGESYTLNSSIEVKSTSAMTMQDTYSINGKTLTVSLYGNHSYTSWTSNAYNISLFVYY